ncbi:MAG: hypothetical protein ACI9FN_003737 [Saprospiraceae bacterium]|jgi:hypothetical protein
MPPQPHPYNQSLKNKYLKLYKHIIAAIRKGRFYTYSIKRQAHLIHLLNRYARRLAIVTGRGITLGSLTVGMLTTVINQAEAQSFTLSPNPTPFGLSDVGTHSAPTLADIDGDGDLDAFVGESNGNINFFRNNGSSTSPNFVLDTNSAPFGLSDVDNFNAPTFADIDGDGDFDAFVGEFDGNINFFENTGSSTSPNFDLNSSAAPFGLSDIGFMSKPTFADIDGDGDFDAFVGEFNGNINFFENTGSSTSPNFDLNSSAAPFGLSDIGFMSKPTFADIDGDGDLPNYHLLITDISLNNRINGNEIGTYIHRD